MPYKLNPLTGKFDYYETGSGSADLATVLNNGNASGANDIDFDALQGILFNNGSRLREGTIDAGLGGAKGIAQICAVGYELKWEAGRLYVMDGNGIYIRHSLYNFNITPTVNDDVTLGYLPGSRWSLDNGDTYLCSDSTTGAAVWVLEVIPITDISMSTAKLLGRTTAGTGAAEEITVGTGLSLSAGNLTAVNPEGWSVIVKSANQDVSGATLTDDTELQFSVVAGGTYMLELTIATAGDSSVNDYRFGFTVSSGTINGSGNAFSRNGTNVATQTALTASATASTNTVPVGQNGGTIPNGSGIIVATANFGFYATANGIVKMQFALVSNTGTARTWKGSILKYKRIN